jgi:hypothetical protein
MRVPIVDYAAEDTALAALGYPGVRVSIKFKA